MSIRAHHASTLTEAVVASLEFRLADELRRRELRDLTDITARFRALPILDERSPEAILGYDRDGLPS